MPLVSVVVNCNVCPLEVEALASSLKLSTDRLAAAVAASGPSFSTAPGAHLPDPTPTVNPVLQTLADQITATTKVIDSAVVLINGIAQRIQDAIFQAVSGGATAEQLKPVQAEVDTLKAGSDALAAAVAANTPAPPPSPPSPPSPPTP